MSSRSLRHARTAAAVSLGTLLALLATGCGAEERSPSDVVKSFGHAWVELDRQEMMNAVCAPLRVQLEDDDTWSGVAERRIVDYEVGDEEVDGDQALVQLTTITRNTDGEKSSRDKMLLLERNSDGEWKVCND
jgi:hypothetical protein